VGAGFISSRATCRTPGNQRRSGGTVGLTMHARTGIGETPQDPRRDPRGDGDPRALSAFPGNLEDYFLGNHPLIRHARSAILRAAAEDWPVLVLGETGTGKDMAAWAIHSASRRRTQPLQIVPVGGLGDTAWSTLFGHRKGAFTGAVDDHDGVFRAAHHSSLLLDDVATLPLKLQPMVLRAIEHGRFRPLGSNAEIHTNVRVISSSNLPLDEEVHEGRFRSDLYERLAVLKIVLPPLRAHLEDLDVYVPHFLKEAARPGRPPKKITAQAVRYLSSHSWPRNVRELKHFLYRCSVEVAGPAIDLSDVQGLLELESRSMPRASRSARPDEFAVRKALAAAAGNKREAARLLGVSPNTLYKLMREYVIDTGVQRQRV